MTKFLHLKFFSARPKTILIISKLCAVKLRVFHLIDYQAVTSSTLCAVCNILIISGLWLFCLYCVSFYSNNAIECAL